MSYKRVAIIGSRSFARASKEIQDQARRFVQNFVAIHKPEWIVSGNAEGADNLSHLFDNNLQYLPWPGYNKHLMVNGKAIVAGDITSFDKEIFEMFPWIKNKSQGVLKLVRRNFAMIRGIEPGNQVDAILYWTESVQVTGGTKYAYELGKKLGIPMFRIDSTPPEEVTIKEPETNRLYTTPMIAEFTGKYKFLSNFYPAKVKLDGQEYPTVENAYQASKTTDAKVRAEFARISPADAKRLGRKVKLRPGFDNIKVKIMFDLVKQKFEDPELAKMLANTGNSLLIEGNNWGDTFWGVCNSVGENHLGKILMQVRKELK
jgi:ribA/ribD-fused uncharacterized protein